MSGTVFCEICTCVIIFFHIINFSEKISKKFDRITIVIFYLDYGYIWSRVLIFAHHFYTVQILHHRNSFIMLALFYILFKKSTVFLKSKFLCYPYVKSKDLSRINVLINTLMRRKLLQSVKYSINSKNNDKHIWKCDVTGIHVSKERTGFYFV